MALYIDGEEVPRVFTLGSNISAEQYDKFGDISKERLQSRSVSHITYYESFLVKTGADTNNVVSSETFSDSDLGRAIVVKGASIYETLIGAYLYISEITSNGFRVKNGLTGKEYIFDTTDELVEISFPPSSGLDSKIVTNLKTQRNSIGRNTLEQLETDNKVKEMHMSGVSYNIDENKIKYEKIEDFLKTFEIEKYKKKKESFTKVKEELDT